MAKKRMLGLFVVLAGLAFSANVLAAWSPIGVITGIRSWGVGYRIQISGASFTGCSASGWADLKSTVTGDAQEEIGKFLLSAYLAGKPVQVLLDGTCSGSGFPNYYAVAM